MICSQCQKEGKTSSIAILGQTVTLMAYINYYDEKGIRHDHDPNDYEISYRCSNGHHWIKKTRMKCPNCDFNKEKA